MKKVIGIIIFSIFFVISTGFLIFVSVIYAQDSSYVDPEYAKIEFVDGVEKREFQFDEFHKVYFFNDRDILSNFSKSTEFVGVIPKLKIVNNNDYRIEINSNSDAFDKLKLGVKDSTLSVSFLDDCYVPVHVNDSSYDYDAGLCVTLNTFEVTIYAPISSLNVDCALELDYDAPKCEKMYVMFSFDGTNANIYNVDTENFTLNCSGTSKLTLSGKVSKNSEIMIFHNTKVNANNFKSYDIDFTVSSDIIGFSYIKYKYWYHIGITRSDVWLTLFFKLAPLIWLCCLIRCIFKKSKK